MCHVHGAAEGWRTPRRRPAPEETLAAIGFILGGRRTGPQFPRCAALTHLDGPCHRTMGRRTPRLMRSLPRAAFLCSRRAVTSAPLASQRPGSRRGLPREPRKTPSGGQPDGRVVSTPLFAGWERVGRQRYRLALRRASHGRVARSRRREVGEEAGWGALGRERSWASFCIGAREVNRAKYRAFEDTSHPGITQANAAQPRDAGVIAKRSRTMASIGCVASRILAPKRLYRSSMSRLR